MKGSLGLGDYSAAGGARELRGGRPHGQLVAAHLVEGKKAYKYLRRRYPVECDRRTS
jgi:hypothetical protein